MSTTPLSAIAYYGGKARMSKWIADRLDYRNTDIYVEPFGGGARVLLNKKPHNAEYYNDWGSGVVELMIALSNEDTATELIDILYETEYSKEEFDRAKKIFDAAEEDWLQSARKDLINFIVDSKLHNRNTSKLNNLVDGLTLVALGGTHNIDSNFLNALRASSPDVQEKYNEKLNRVIELFKSSEKGNLLRPRDMGVEISDMELAAATYIVFTQSRDAMGQTWSEKKMTTTAYRRRILRLYDCAKRLKDVTITQIDARDYCRNASALLNMALAAKKSSKPPTLLTWLYNPRVMMYLDPSYISAEKEAAVLEKYNIDVDKVTNVSEAIRAANNNCMPPNLGSPYTSSFSYEQQEQFLRIIRYAKCRVMVSNYNLELYHKYLSADNGWRFERFETTTSVGGKRGNKRTEVIWMNY